MKKIIILMLAMILLSISVQSQYYTDYTGDASGGAGWNDYGDIEIVEWYELTPYEIDVCHTWAGGTEPAEALADDPGSLVAPLTKTSVHISGQVSTLQDMYLYELSWYVQPFPAEDIIYIIYLIEDDGTEVEHYTGHSQTDTGDAGYEVLPETEIVYESLRIMYEDDAETGGWGAITIPFIEKEEY